MGTPAKPATTPSLSGSKSTRTDGPVGKSVASKQAMRYAAGEPGAKDFYDIQGQAAMEKTPDVKGMPTSQIAAAAAQGQGQPAQAAQPMQNPITAIPLGAPSQNPNEPVTNGAAAGPGAGPEALILPNQVQTQYENAYQMFQQMASNPNASPAMKYLAQRIGQGF